MSRPYSKLTMVRQRSTSCVSANAGTAYAKAPSRYARILLIELATSCDIASRIGNFPT